MLVAEGNDETEGDDRMIRGTTPDLEFELPIDTSLLKEAYVTFSQGGMVRIDKALADCRASGNKLTLRLTQEETLKLKSGTVTEIQIRIRTVNGEAIASEIISEPTERILKDGVI